MLTLQDILAARERLQGVIHKTPVLTSTHLDELSGNRLFFKCENFQRTGAFKIRGAYNALSQLSADARRRGVVAYSSGNHAQGVALAAKILGLSAKIVMPSDAPDSKVAATRGYGAEIIFYDRYAESREAIAQSIQEKDGRTLIPPFDHDDIIAGQGTIAVEMHEEIGKMDVLLIPVGGGGLIAGNAVAIKALNPATAVYGVEIAGGDDVALSLKAGHRVSVKPFKTLADGIQTLSPGEMTFPIMQKHLSGVLIATEDEMRAALKLVLLRMKILIEPSSAVTVAAVLKNELKWRDKRIGVLLCGGNVDGATLAEILRS